MSTSPFPSSLKGSGSSGSSRGSRSSGGLEELEGLEGLERLEGLVKIETGSPAIWCAVRGTHSTSNGVVLGAYPIGQPGTTDPVLRFCTVRVALVTIAATIEPTRPTI